MTEPPRGQSKLGPALGPDHSVYGAFVDISLERGGGPVSMPEIAERVGCGEAKVAIAMKYGVINGLAEVMPGRGARQWRPTELGKAQYRDGGVIPVGEPVEVAPGVTVRPLAPGEEPPPLPDEQRVIEIPIRPELEPGE